MTALTFSESALVAAVRSREIIIRKLLDHCLERVECYNPKINTIVTLDYGV